MVNTARGSTSHPDTTGKSARLPRIGEVVSIWTRTTTDDTGPDSPTNHEASVLLDEFEEPRRLPIHQDFPGTAGVPIPGDAVRIEYMGGVSESPVITGYAYTNDIRPPLAEQGHWRRKFGSLYLEAEKTDHSALSSSSEYNVVRMAKKPDGLSDPTTQVAIDDSGGTVQVKIETDGDITISAGGDVVIDEGGTTKAVLTEDAVFEYEDTGDTSDGSATPTTKQTTTVSNGETTQTQIE